MNRLLTFNPKFLGHSTVSPPDSNSIYANLDLRGQPTYAELLSGYPFTPPTSSTPSRQESKSPRQPAPNPPQRRVVGENGVDNAVRDMSDDSGYVASLGNVFYSLETIIKFLVFGLFCSKVHGSKCFSLLTLDVV